MEYNESVSVVMPVHNGERYLRESIESVLNQTYINFEFLIIENCSTDSSAEIIKSYKDPRIRLIVEEECGQVQAYNRGFKEAKGEYIFIHDQDDISHPERFKMQIECVISSDVDICGTFITLIDEKGFYLSDQIKKISWQEIGQELLYNPTAIHNSTVCIKKSVFNKNGYWQRQYYPVADCEFYMNAFLTDFTFGNIPAYLYKYRRHKSQITANDKKKSLIIFRDTALKYSHKIYGMIKKDFYRNKGLVYYYTNNLPLAFFNLLVAIMYGEKSKKTLRYLIIIFFLGIPLSIIRRTRLIETKYFMKLKIIFNKILKL
jgi:glycosyltransferase involved in cell wall biosynthesis